MSGIYNISGEKMMTKAHVEKFNNQQMPSDMAAFHAFHLNKQFETTEKESGKMQEEADKIVENEVQLKELTELLSEQIDVNTEDAPKAENGVEEETPNTRKKVQFTKLVKSSVSSEWEDIGSQTDHSDMSEGHYSDETTEEKYTREHRNKTKSEKRVRRMAEINRKHNIID